MNTVPDLNSTSLNDLYFASLNVLSNLSQFVDRSRRVESFIGGNSTADFQSLQAGGQRYK
jgi:hypothetical protein